MRASLAQRGYRLLLRGLTLPLLGWLWLRGQRDAGYRQRMGERLGFIPIDPSALGGIWIHAASVGEVHAARPLISALLEEWPAHAITVSTQSPTGARTLQSLWGERIRHVYAPIDTPGAVRRFLDRLQPSKLVLIEREIWPEILWQCADRQIAVALVNARLSADSAQFYQRWRRLMGPIWRQLAVVAAVDASSLSNYAALGVPSDKLVLTGNLKFDQQPPTAEADPLPWLCGRPIVVAGSTHEGEEAALLQCWPELVRQNPGALLILVPRHPERFDSVAAQIAESGLPFVRRSKDETPQAATCVMLADTMGELVTWYQHASVCFIGGSLVPVGGHNALEAMACAKPVLFGPHTHHFQELYQDVEASGAGDRVDSARLLLHRASQWMRDKGLLQRKGQMASEFVLRQQGSSQRTLEALQRVGAPMNPRRLTPVAVQADSGHSIWYDPAQVNGDARSLFTAPTEPRAALATGSGRGQAHRTALDKGEGVLRHYRRGGMMARLSEDRFFNQATQRSRAMREYALLRLMGAWQLPVPAPVAARQSRGALTYTADIVVAMIPGTRNVAECLSQSALDAPAWRALGRAIRHLHDHQVFHSDLNCHNLLLDEQGQAWVVDFDKCSVRSGQEWKTANLERLLRSLRKEQSRRPGFHWQEERWADLLDGYGPPLPGR